MTYTDCWIRTQIGEADAKALYGDKHLLLEQPRQRIYWDREVENLAKEHNLPIRYHDNCWVEIEVSRETLLKFFRQTFGEDYALLASIANIPVAAAYQLTGESF
jgi:hypothetical protein